MDIADEMAANIEHALKRAHEGAQAAAERIAQEAAEEVRANTPVLSGETRD